MTRKPERTYPEDAPMRQKPVIEIKMRRIVNHLQSVPSVQIACQRAGVSRATYYRWRANDFEFSRACDYALEAGRFLVNDAVEATLINKAKNGDGASIRYWLSHNHPRYSRRFIPEYSHINDFPSTEEKQREQRRNIRNDEVVVKGMKEILTGKIDDGHEREAYEKLDGIFERFDMLGPSDEGEDIK